MKVKINAHTELSPKVKFYSLTAQDTEQLFSPGQYLSFLIPREEGRVSVRAYSFVSDPAQWPDFNLCVKQISGGVGTEFLLANVGQIVETSGPQGNFVLPEDEEQKLLFVAQGVGISPVRSMLRAWAKKAKNRFCLAYRFPAENEFIFGPEFTKMNSIDDRFDLVDSNSTTEGREAYFDRLKVAYKKTRPTLIYLVGNPQFVKDHTDLFTNWGVELKDIKIDIWET